MSKSTMDETKIVKMTDIELKDFALGLVERMQSLKNLRKDDVTVAEFSEYDRMTYREPVQQLTRKIKLVRREFKNRELEDEIISKGVLE